MPRRFHRYDSMRSIAPLYVNKISFVSRHSLSSTTVSATLSASFTVTCLPISGHFRLLLLLRTAIIKGKVKLLTLKISLRNLYSDRVTKLVNVMTTAPNEAVILLIEV